MPHIAETGQTFITAEPLVNDISVSSLMWIWLKHIHCSSTTGLPDVDTAETSITFITTKSLVNNLSVSSLMWIWLKHIPHS